MRVIKPQVEILPRMEPLKKIELCGRVCYKSEGKITEDSAERFVRKLIERGHTSVLEHARVIVPDAVFWRFDQPLGLPYGYEHRLAWVKPPVCGGKYPHIWERMINARDVITLGGTLEQLKTLEEADDYMTVRFICDRAIANELVRHRVFSFSAESTRYVNYKDGIDFILPAPFDWADLSGGPTEMPDAFTDPRYQAWFFACEGAEREYRKMLTEGCTPQEARNVLTMSTKTELIMTGTYKQWEELLKLRMSSAAHPQMQYLMRLLIEQETFPEELKHWRKENGND